MSQFTSLIDIVFFQRKRVNFSDPPTTSQKIFITEEVKSEEIEPNTEDECKLKTIENPSVSTIDEIIGLTPVVDCIKDEMAEIEEQGIAENVEVQSNEIKQDVEENEFEKSKVDEQDNYRTSEDMEERNGENTESFIDLIVPVKSYTEEINSVPVEINVFSKEAVPLPEETKPLPEKSNLVPKEIISFSEEEPLAAKTIVLSQETVMLQKEIKPLSEKFPERTDLVPKEKCDEVPESEEARLLNAKLKDEDTLWQATSSEMLDTKKQESNISKCRTYIETGDCLIAQLKDIVSITKHFLRNL